MMLPLAFRYRPEIQLRAGGGRFKDPTRYFPLKSSAVGLLISLCKRKEKGARTEIDNSSMVHRRPASTPFFFLSVTLGEKPEERGATKTKRTGGDGGDS